MTIKQASLAVVAVALSTLAIAAVPGAASAAVEWDSEVLQAPTNLPPGGRGTIWINVANVGSDPSTTRPTVAFQLPPGVTVGTPAPPQFWTCTGTSAVSCGPSFASPVAANTYANSGGAVHAIRLTVDVAPGAPEGGSDFPVTLSGGGGALVGNAHRLSVGSQPLGFGPAPGSFMAGAFDEAGDDYTQAGGHPYEARGSFSWTTRFTEMTGASETWFRSILGVDPPKDVVVDLPPGFVGDPTAVPKCPDLDLVETRACPAASQVGVATISPPSGATGKNRMFGVYNVEPASNHPAEFAFRTPVGIVQLVPTLRSDGDMGITAIVRNITEADTVFASSVTLWGVPADPVHDIQRCANPNFVAQACVGFDEAGSVWPVAGQGSPHSSSAALKPFLTNPTRCTGAPVITGLHLSSWANPARFEVDGDPDLSDPSWKSASATAPPVTGCDKLQFGPSIQSRATTAAPDSPTGLDFQLTIPQTDDRNVLATAHLRDTTVVLPEGMVVNASSADGLDACTSAQIGLVSKQPPRFTKLEPSCPSGSKIGTVEVHTPLLEELLTGEVFVAAQGDNPFDSLLAIYLVVRGPGLLVKLAGHVEPDPQTGRLKTTVLDNPQLPFDTVDVRIKSGSRAPLKTPESCGGHFTTAAFTSWAGQAADVSDSFGVGCPGTAGAYDPGFSAGATNPVGGSYSPFSTRITRPNGKELGRVNVKLPKGMLAGVKDVAVCTEAQLATAASKSGRATQSGPACPAGSQIGTVTAGAGAGPTPFYPRLPGSDVSGRVFLTQRHANVQHGLAGARQAAYGLAIEVPAVAGPFDLGTVMVRAAIYVDPVTAQITAVSDQMPRILQGIPLDVRDIRVDIARDRFSTTPTSCEEKQVRGDIVAQDGAVATRNARYQVGECGSLRFKPRLALRLTGKRQRTTGKHPGVRAVVRQTGVGEAGINRAEVRLPKSLALDPDNAQALCEFEDGTKPNPENRCPKGSIVGRRGRSRRC